MVPSRVTGWTLGVLIAAVMLAIFMTGTLTAQRSRRIQIESLNQALPALATDAITRVGRLSAIISTLLDMAHLHAQLVGRGDQEAAAGVARQIQHLLDFGNLGLHQITWINAGNGAESTFSNGPGMPLGGQIWTTPHDAGSSQLIVNRYPAFPGEAVQMARIYHSTQGPRAGVAATLIETDWLSTLIHSNAAPPGTEFALFDLSDGSQLTGGSQLISPTLLRSALTADQSVVLSDANTALGPALLVAQRLPETPVAVVVEMPYSVIIANAGHAAVRAAMRAAQIAVPLAILLIAVLALLRWRNAVDARITIAAGRENAESEARRRMERLIRDMSTALFAGAAGPRGGFVLDYVSGNIDRFCARRIIKLGLGRRGSCIAVDHRALRGFVRKVVAEGEAAATLQGQAPDGQTIWLRLRGWRGTPQRGGRRFELYGQIADISREQEMQAAVINSSKFATLGELAAGLAHEVMQPVTAMSFAAENILLALDSPDPAQMQKSRARLDLIIEQAQRVRGIVDHLRIFTRGETTGSGPVSLQQAFSGAMLLTGMALRQSSVEVVAHLPETLPKVTAQLVPLEQVFVNLLSNARDALAEQVGPRRIQVSAWARGDTVLVHIADNGPGIPEEVRKHIFEPFFTTKGAKTGTGLGLWLCAGTLSRYGGQLRAITPEGGGAVFEMTLPRYHESTAATAWAAN